MESELIDPKWFIIVVGGILGILAAIMWWAGVLKKR